MVGLSNNAATSNRTGLSFSKEDHDVSQIFLAYLAFLGNSTKVGIALNMRPEVVEVLAAKEDWAGKLKTYVGLRHEEALSEPDNALRRTATYFAACQLRDTIKRLIDHMHELTDDDRLMDWFSPRNPRTNKPKFDPRILFDLCRAFQVATRIILRAEIKESDQPPDEYTEKERVTIREAITRAMRAMDRLRGVDSVALAAESLAKWSDAGKAPTKEEAA
jgi:hypothetical protein